MTQVRSKSHHKQGREFDLPDDRVATAAQEAADATRPVTVVHDQRASGRVTQKAATVLRFVHLVNLLRSEAVLPLQTRADVLPPRSLRVGPTPLSQTLVSPLAIRLTVFAVAATRALAALAATQSPVRERFGRQIARALAAVGHASIMPCDTNTQALDQPCHADVLLELANAQEPSDV